MTWRPVSYYANSCRSVLDIWFCLASGVNVQVAGGGWHSLGWRRGEWGLPTADGAFRGDATSRSTPNGHGAQGKKGTDGLGGLRSWILGIDVGVEIFGTKL